jgi:lipid-binding SYLF domain-containing protein
MAFKGELMQRQLKVFSLVLLILYYLIGLNGCATSSTSRSINLKVDTTLHLFKDKVPAGKELLQKAKGVLVFPEIIKAGIGLGGEFGEGALRIGGKTVDYYNSMAASIGFQLGAQAKSVVMLFNTSEALDNFRNSEGWKVGIDGSVALISIGMGDSIDTINANEPVVAFIFDQKGLMYNLTLEGTKFNKIVK